MAPEPNKVDLSYLGNVLEGVFPESIDVISSLFGHRATGMMTVAMANHGRQSLQMMSYLSAARSFVPHTDTGFRDFMNLEMPFLEEDGNYVGIGCDQTAMALVRHRQIASHAVALELAEDFRLFWDLHEKKEECRFFYYDEYGNESLVAETTSTEAKIEATYLRRYLAARQLVLVRQFTVDATTELSSDILTKGDLISDGKNHLIELYRANSSDPAFVILSGVHYEYPARQDLCNVGPFEKPCDHLDFIVDTDRMGNPILTSSDAAHKGPEYPHLTTVFFSRDVLDRYYDNPDKYRSVTY